MKLANWRAIRASYRLYVVTDIWHKMLRVFIFFERSERNFRKRPDFDSIHEEDPELLKDEALARFKEINLRRSGVKVTGEQLAKHPISIFFGDISNGLKHRCVCRAPIRPLTGIGSPCNIGGIDRVTLAHYIPAAR